jgi:glucosamine-6-phosphate deaminase
MNIQVFDTKQELGSAAAQRAAAAIGEALARAGEARVIAATGASQFEFLDALTATAGLDWGRVDMFHLDEYVGVSDRHPASFRRYLRERIVERVHPRSFEFLAGDGDPAGMPGWAIARAPIDVASWESARTGTGLQRPAGRFTTRSRTGGRSTGVRQSSRGWFEA